MELWALTATAIADGVRRRAFSAREAAVSALARLDAANPALNAVIARRREETLRDADAVDAAIRRGETPPLAGVPVTIKDNLDQAGFATTNGLRSRAGTIAEADSPAVANLRAAGAVVLGRTNVPAFSIRWFTDNLLFGATTNPHNKTLTPGGSSGGAASAVAAGIGAVAMGTDVAGSIRYPAYACGVHGIRPSLGRVAAYNATMPERGIGGQLTAVAGPLARSIPDLRLALAALSALDARDAWQVQAPLSGPAYARRARLCAAPEGMDVAPVVVAALHDAAARLRDAGWDVTEGDVPPLREPAALQTALWMAESRANAALFETEGDAAALHVFRSLSAMAGDMTLEGFAAALTQRAALVRAWQVFLRDTPLVLLPVSGELPFPVDLDLRDLSRVNAAQMIQSAVPFLGLPAIAVATGFAGSAPLGVQMIAARMREDILFDAAEALAPDPVAPVDPAR